MKILFGCKIILMWDILLCYQELYNCILHIKKNLQNRYAIARNTENQRKLLEEKTKAVHGNLQLIHATNDIYIPDSFYNDITFNLDKKRISKEKAFELLKVVDGLNNDL